MKCKFSNKDQYCSLKGIKSSRVPGRHSRPWAHSERRDISREHSQKLPLLVTGGSFSDWLAGVHWLSKPRVLGRGGTLEILTELQLKGKTQSLDSQSCYICFMHHDLWARTAPARGHLNQRKRPWDTDLGWMDTASELQLKPNRYTTFVLLYFFFFFFACKPSENMDQKRQS